MRLLFGRPVRVGGRQPRHLTGLPFNWPSRSVAHTPYSQDGSDRLTIPAVSAIRSDDDRLSAVVAIFRTCARDHPDRDHTCPRSPCPAARPRRRASSLRFADRGRKMSKQAGPARHSIDSSTTLIRKSCRKGGSLCDP